MTRSFAEDLQDERILLAGVAGLATVIGLDRLVVKAGWMEGKNGLYDPWPGFPEVYRLSDPQVQRMVLRQIRQGKLPKASLLISDRGRKAVAGLE